LLQPGARQVIDYRSERFEDVADTVDVVIDAVGGSTLERSWNILAPGSRLVTIVVVSETEADELAKRDFFNDQPNAEQLENIRPSENRSFVNQCHALMSC
jgi:NADPH:quinone reductase-like Zn-dependent oxidoreductase